MIQQADVGSFHGVTPDAQNILNDQKQLRTLNRGYSTPLQYQIEHH
jgi:hypothetical protein